MKIVILSDSVCLPRPKGSGNIPYEDTFPYLLDCELRKVLGPRSPTIIERGKRQRIIEHVLKDWNDEVALKQAEIVIVQVGGSDCAPRVFMPHELELLEKLPFKAIRNKILRFENRRRREILLWMPQRTLTPLHKFRERASQITLKAKATGVKLLVFVSIMPLTEKISHHLPGVARNVDLYNEALEAQSVHPGVVYLDVKKIVDESGGIDQFSLDGMHYTKRGHQIFAEALSDCILQNTGFEVAVPGLPREFS